MENDHPNNGNSTQYIKSNNRGNTFDNVLRTTKEDDLARQDEAAPLQENAGQEKAAGDAQLENKGD